MQVSILDEVVDPGFPWEEEGAKSNEKKLYRRGGARVPDNPIESADEMSFNNFLCNARFNLSVFLITNHYHDLPLLG